MKISVKRGRSASINNQYNLNSITNIQKFESIGNTPNNIKLSNGKEIKLFEDVPSYYLEWYSFLKGACSIPYYDLEGNRQTYRLKASGRFKQGQKDYFVRYRLHPERCTNKQKYHQFAKTGARIYNTPKVIEAYLNGTKVNRAFIVEGEKKAIAGAVKGNLYTIGTGGKDLFREKGNKELHSDLKKFINKCKVNELVLFIDNDFNKGNKKRRVSFYNTIRNFINACELAGVIPFIQWIDESTGVKAIDDLFNKYPKRIKELSETIKKGETTAEIKSIKLNEYSRKQLRSHILYDTPLDQYFNVSGYLSENLDLTKALCNSIGSNDITIFNAGTGKGKTSFIMNGSLNQYLSEYNIRFLAPLKTIVEQSESKYRIPAIYGGNSLDHLEDIESTPKIISTFASVDKLPLDGKTLLVIDEAHLCSDWGFLDIVSILKAIGKVLNNGGKVLFMSATNDELLKDSFPENTVNRITVTSKQRAVKVTPMFYESGQTESLIQTILKEKKESGVIVVKLNDKNKLAEIKEEIIKRGVFLETEIAKFTANTEDELSKEYRELIESQTLGNDIKLVLTTSKIQEGVNILNKNISLFIAVEPREARSFVQLIGRSRESENVRAIALFSAKFKEKKGYFQNNHATLKRLNDQLSKAPICSIPVIDESELENTPKEFHSKINWKDSCLYSLNNQTFINPFAVIKEVNDIETYFMNFDLWQKKVLSIADNLLFQESIHLDEFILSNETKIIKEQIKEHRSILKEKSLELVTNYIELVKVASAVYMSSKDTKFKSKLQRVFGFNKTNLKDGDTFRKMNPELFERTKIVDYIHNIVELIDTGLDRHTAMTVVEMNEGNLNKIRQEINRIVYSNLKKNGVRTQRGLQNMESLKEMESILFNGAESIVYSKDELIKTLQKKCGKRFSKGTPNEIRNKLNGCAIVNTSKEKITLFKIKNNYLETVKNKSVFYKKKEKKIGSELPNNNEGSRGVLNSLTLLPAVTTLSA